MQSYEDWKKGRPAIGGSSIKSVSDNNDPLSSFEAFKAAKSRGVDVNALARERARFGMAEAEKALKEQQSNTIQLKPEAETLPERKPSLGETLKSSSLGFSKSFEKEKARSMGDFRAGFSTYIPQTKQLLSGAVMAVGDAVGSERISKLGLEKYRAAEKDIQPFQEGRPTSLEDIHGVGSAIDWAQYNLGNLTGSALESLGAAAVGALAGSSVPGAGNIIGAGAGLVAKKSVKTFIEKKVGEHVAKGVARDVAEKSAVKALNKKVGAGVGMFASSYIQGVGDVYGETMNEEGKGSAMTAFLGAVPYAALDTITDMSVLDKIFKGSEGEKALIRYSKAILSGGIKEGAQESAQEADLLLAGLANGKEYSSEEVLSRLGNSFAAAGLGGGVAGIPGGRKMSVVMGSPSDVNPPSMAEEAPKVPEDTSDTTLPKYEAKKNVRSLFSALENDDMESVQEISSKMSKKELTDFRSSFEDMQIDEEVVSNPDILDKVSRDIETLNALIEEKKSKITQEANNIVEGKPSEGTLHVSDANAVKGIVEQVKQAVDEETKAKIDESVSKIDTGTLPGVSEARALENESNPFREISEFEALNESYSEKSGEFINKKFELKEKKKEMLAQKKLAQSREEKASIQKSIDDLDSERRDVEAKLGVIEEQGRSHALVLAQNIVDKIKEIEPSFDVAKSVDDNWELEDYTSYYEGIKQSKKEPYAEPKPKRRAVSRIEPVAERKPELPSEGSNKYAEEAGRDTGTDGGVAGERSSDGRGLAESIPKKTIVPKKQSIEELALSKDTFSEDEKDILSQYEGAGATRESGRGILDEFFTPEKVAEKVWDIVSTYIPKKGGVLSVLEPSVGTGRFIKVAPENTKFRAYETNKVSAKITEKLHKNAVVSNEPFESIFIDEKGKKKAFEPKYDVVVGNPPYGTHRGKYKGLGEEPKIGKYEEYFLKRSLDLTKEGGIVAMVVPSGFIRGAGSHAKREISNMAFLVDAYRLPNKIFKGTEIGTDIVVFQKGKQYAGTATLSQITGDNYFKNYPEKVLGTPSQKRGRFGMEDIVEGSIEDALSKIAVDRISALMGVSEEVEANTEKITDEKILVDFFGEEGRNIGKPEYGKQYRLTGKDSIAEGSTWEQAMVNEVMEEYGNEFPDSEMENGYQRFVSIFKNSKMRNKKIKDTVSAGDFETMKKEVSRLGIMRAVDFSNLFYSDEQSESEVFELFRDRLEKEAAEVLYGKRVAQNLGKVKEKAIVEGVKAELRPMKRIVKTEKDHIRRDSEKPYVLLSTKKGGIQVIDQVSASEEERYLYDNTLEDGSIDPKADFDKESANLFNGKYYTDINYASGDIYKKLSALESEKEKMSVKQYNRQKSLLESVLPKRMGIQDISIVPISEMAKMSLGGVSLVDRFSEWLKTLPFEAFEGSNKYQIAEYINGNPVNVGDKARNREIRKQRRDIGNKLFQKFYKDELPKEFQDSIEERFNRENNSIHTPNYAEYPFSTQLSKTFDGKPLSLRPIQIEGASFLVNKGVGILAYEVGVGKTLSAIAAISEVMRRGWTKKPLIVVPKNLRSKWIREIADAIPGVKINDLGNLGADLKFKGDMKDFSIDENSLSIITEEGFKRIGFGEETFESLTKDLKDVTYEKGEKSARAKASEDVKAEETIGKARRGTEFPLTFEELGFDHITFDEAHREKNVFAKAKVSKGDRKSNEYDAVRGSVSERGLKAYLATQYILKENKGRNVFLLTATPFNNSPVEIYSMLSLVAKNRLEDMGIKNINDFISLYIQLETKLAFKADGQYKETNQVRKFQNLRQLQLLVREYIDFRTGEEAGVPRPAKIRKKQFLKMNETQWNAVKGAQVLFEDTDAGVLKAITELQKITLSPYLSRFSHESMASVSPKEFIEKSPKIKYTVEAIKKVHKANPKAGQIVFVEKGVEVFTPMLQHFVKDLKYKPNEVAIMDGSVAEARRDEIKEKFHSGEIKILMTTIKEGVDLQRTSTDLYNLYLPWNPTDLVQIEGRTWRQGSIYDKVRIHYPLLENSVDVFLFQKLEEKAARLASVFSYKGNDLDVSDIDFEAMKIDLITDPALRAEAEYSLKLTKLGNAISRLKSEKAFIEKKAGTIADINKEINEYTENIARFSKNDSYKYIVASYDQKITNLKEDLAKEIDRLRKNGVDVDEITRKINEKDQELLAITSEREGLLSEKERKISEAKKAPSKDVYGDTNFDELTEGMDDAGFFVEIPGMAFFLSHSSDPLLEEVRKYKSAEEFVKAQGTINPDNIEYHGTGKSFDRFVLGEEGSSGAGTENLGVFTTKSKNAAKFWAEKSAGVGKDGNVVKVYLDIKNPKVFKSQEALDNFLGDNPEQAIEMLKKQGFDAIKYPESGIDKFPFDYWDELASKGVEFKNKLPDEPYMTTQVFDPKKVYILGKDGIAGIKNKIGNPLGEYPFLANSKISDIQKINRLDDYSLTSKEWKLRVHIENYANKNDLKFNDAKQEIIDAIKTKSQLTDLWNKAHSEPHLFAYRSIRGKDGKFTGSTPAHPDTISNKEIKTYLKSERAKEIIKKIKVETNPAIRSVLQYHIAKELVSYKKEEGNKSRKEDPRYETLGYFTPQNMDISLSLAQSEEQFERVFRHEIRHAAFILLPREKQILIENWYKKLYQEKDHRELINIFGGKPGDFGNYEDMSRSGRIFEWDGITPVDPITFMADEAFNRFMDYRGERTSLQKMMDKMILAIYRLLSRINASIFSDMRDRKELDILYDNVFSQKENAFDVPAELMLMLRDKFIIPGRILEKDDGVVSGGSAFAQNLFGEQTPERKEQRRIYMRAFEKVLAEKRPPSLGKMVEEAFAVKERRTMITAEKLQALTETVEDLAMTEGMQAGYLEGETSAVLAREEEIKTLQTKLESVEHIKDQAEAVKEELNEKSYDRLKALMSLQRKMEWQATRYKEQKESLLKRFSEKKLEMKESAKQDIKETKQKYEKRMRDLQAIREEMYDYVKEHLPRKNWDKYLRFIRDAKTRENLQKLFESVDEDVKKIQRSAVISKIKKILGKAEDLPIQYQMMVKKITEDIDWGNMLPSTKEKLKKINEYLEKNPEAETSMPFRILKRLKILSKQSYKTLSTEQLLALSAKLELIQHVGRIAKSQNKANMAKGRADKLALLQKMSTNFDIFKQSGLTREEKEKITFWEKSLNTLQSTEFQLMPMDFFFYILDGKQEMGTNYQLIKKPIDEAFNGYWKQSNEIKSSLSKFIDKLKLEGLEFTDTMWDRIGIHAIRAQKGGTAKLLGSGYEQSAIDDVVLNEKELAMYGYLRQELDKMFPAIKEVYARVHNIELEGVDEYFPFLMDWSNREPVYKELEEQYNNKKGVSGSGFTIKRVGGSNPVRVHALESFLKHVDQATYFISLEEAVREVRSIISSHRYKEAVGEKAQAYVEHWLEVVERHGVPENDKQVAFFDALRRNITLGTLAFKLSTIPIQFGAIFNGASMIGKSAFSGFGEIVTSKEAREFVLGASEQIKMRVGDSPEFIEDVPTERKGAIGRKLAKGLNASREYGMWAIKKADYYTAAGTWLGAYKNHLKLSGQEFDMQNVDQEARAYADMVVRMTQGSNEFKDMPPLIAQKYRTFGKLLLQFQNFSLFQWNFARQVVGKNISTDKSKAAWQATMIFANVVFAMQIRALISRGIWGAPPDDEESWIAAILWELTQQIPLLGSQFYNLEQFLKNPTYYAAESWKTGIVAVDTTVEAVKSIPKVFAEQKEETRKKSVVKAAESVGTLLGVPSSSQMSQIWRAFLTKD